ncbi:ABC transporter ATP-binding protein [Anaerococcus hydrogenalis]|uniref:ABC transporter ATP-binding protein n=1 Tax=Anaerococcus hydrogenalis TaxID=33029 RepID=A0A2N6ULC2_9FIRM|nr:ABC transporter ATP-binding protein [Anaerococcus hydrogenalis]MDK7694556.1 ABC transporter ATP-binding protein [Anaerococcus hydrogenalis]MDK7696334.1 ABC transporter ATP-binding protein [Anaerococcus hydrogenalis]MDK7707583.1 ABC transporter ATP-binding protein [Anaerococcus hydrogenalis]PMC82596.1 ABC transporter ATP-binding protein [Anaerococcus hydrogenalis]
MYKKFKWFIDYYKKNYIIGIIFLLLSDVVSLFLPYIIGKLIDLIYQGSIDIYYFTKIIIFTIIIIILKYFLAMGWSYNVFKASGSIEYLTRNKLMKKFLGQSQEFFENNSTGSLMGKSTNDITQISIMAGYGTLSLIDATVLPLSIILVMIFTIDLRLTLLSILPLPFIALIYFKIGDKIYDKSKKVNQAFDKLNDTVLEDAEGIRIIRVFNIVENRRKLFYENADKLAKNNIILAKYQALLAPVERIITSLTFIIAIGFGAFLMNLGQISIGQIVSFTYYLNMLVWPMYALGDFINLKQQASASMDRINETLEYKEDIINSSNKKSLDSPVSIEFDKHSFKYPSSKNNILNEISLKIKASTLLGILGKTSSGKTTLIKQLLDIYRVDKSSIYFNDDVSSDISFKSFKEKIGYVPQQHMIFSDTLRNNILFSNENVSEEELLIAIEIADFKKDIDGFELGLETVTGEKGVSLSGGQKQRLSIARAVVNNPEILILDDAMSAVDANTEKNILNNLIKYRKDKTTIIIAHRISQVQNCDNIIVLDEGEISEMGNHDELMKNGKWYKKQYEDQILGDNNEQL